MLQPKFKLGDRVKRNAFTDCFGQYQPECTGLVVTGVQLEVCEHIPNYYRFTAHGGTNGRDMYEGAERFFDFDDSRIIRVDSWSSLVPEAGSRQYMHFALQNAVPCWMESGFKYQQHEGR